MPRFAIPNISMSQVINAPHIKVDLSRFFIHPDATFDGTGADEEVQGGGGTDVMYGDGGLDVLWGNGGSDRLFAGSNDGTWEVGQGRYTPGFNLAELNGGSGNDVLTIQSGARGSFMLDGGWDSDRLVVKGGGDVLLLGGEHADTFQFGKSFKGDASIQDFDLGIDKIKFDWNWSLVGENEAGNAMFEVGPVHTADAGTVEVQGISYEWALQHLGEMIV